MTKIFFALFLIAITPIIVFLFPALPPRKRYEGTFGAISSLKSWDQMTTQERDELWKI